MTRKLGGCLIAVFLLLSVGSLPSAWASDGEILHYRPQPRPLKFVLSIAGKSHALSLWETGPLVEQEDVLNLSQKVETAGDGLLKTTWTVQGINREQEAPKTNSIHLVPRGGSGYKRKDIIGNSGHTLINLLGAVREAKAIPHIGSVYFHPESLNGPPLDIYGITTLIYPRFPLRALKEGDRWKIKDEITIEPAEALLIGGLGTLKHELNMTVKRELAYTLNSFVQKGSHRTAHIGFKGTFSMEGEMITQSGGDFIEADGKCSGAFYFALEEGLLMESLIETKVTEQKSTSGNTVHWFNSETNMAVFLGQPTAPLTWVTEKDLHFVLVE
jgi:hypothetical protein